LDFGDKHKYWCDVRGALDNSELLNGGVVGGGPAVY
jgi:hypothetical protein